MATKQSGAKKAETKGKTKKIKKAGWKINTLYNLAGDKIVRKNRFCPKCGPGMFLGAHADRAVCGHCGYVEYGKK